MTKGMDRWRRIGQSSERVWATCATELGLRYRRGTVHKPPVIWGYLSDYHVEVTCTNDREGHVRPVTLYTVRYRSSHPPIRIDAERLLPRLRLGRKASMVNDVEIGWKDFDSAAVIDAMGSQEISVNDFTLTTTQMPGLTFGLYFFGDQQTQNPIGGTSQGILCAAGPLLFVWAHSAGPSAEQLPHRTFHRTYELTARYELLRRPQIRLQVPIVPEPLDAPAQRLVARLDPAPRLERAVELSPLRRADDVLIAEPDVTHHALELRRVADRVVVGARRIPQRGEVEEARAGDMPTIILCLRIAT